tara:strand:- start:490 stop:894 length:405 start_codon:yes stop_codon:yes gene_type:complete
MLELIKTLTVDGQENIKIYQLIKDLFDLLNKNDWFVKYVFWELDLLKFVGFDLNIKNFCKNEIINEKKVYFVENSFKKIIVPNFLVEKCDVEKISNKDIYNSLYLIGEYMKKNIFVPNNVNIPISRQNFMNYFK